MARGPRAVRGAFVAVVVALVIFAATPVAAQASGDINQAWLARVLTAWKPSHNVSIATGAAFQRAGYGNLEAKYNTLGVEEADLGMLLSTNATCVRIDLGYAPWLQHDQTAIDEATALIQQVRAAGRCLVLADAASETYRNGGQPLWTAFQQAWVQRVKTLASLFRPDYYIVVKEPGWYFDLVSDAKTNRQFQNVTTWLGLTQTLASTVLAASPGTKVGVSVAADSLDQPGAQGYASYLDGVKDLSEVAFVGYDLYTATGFNATQGFLSTHGSGGKAVWIAEAWSGDGQFIHNDSRAQLDRGWMAALYYFAIQINATMVIPFYTDLFSSYALTDTAPPDSTQILSLYRQRTPVFYEFQSVVSGAVSGPTAPGVGIETTTSGNVPKQGYPVESVLAAMAGVAIVAALAAVVIARVRVSARRKTV